MKKSKKLSILLIITLIFCTIIQSTGNVFAGDEQEGASISDQKQGAFYTQNYRNVFKEYGYSESEIEKKVNDTWQALFYGDENTRIYYPVGNNEAYILDTGNLDVRSEGMSYGMMMCVQMDKKAEFDRLWTWAKNYMQQKDGRYKNYFAWSVAPDGRKLAQGPAPDGEEFFIMALLFASHRWGDGSYPYDYSNQAKTILHECVHKSGNGGNPMWDPNNKLIKFGPESNYTDPSYHLPHFYELFSIWGNPEDKDFWAQAAEESRKYLKKACHPVTGLAPEYASYDGTPNKAFWGGNSVSNFYSDAYRVAANIGLDYEWFGKDMWQREQANNIQAFFADINDIQNYYRYTIDGTQLQEKALHPVGLLATNAMASLASDGPNNKKFVDMFWNTPVRTGNRRYYDNCLYFFSVLALSGNYRIW